MEYANLEPIPPKLSLESARKNAGYTQEQLAEILELERNTVAGWEKGKVKVKAHHIYALAYVLGVHPDFLRIPEKILD